VITPAQIRAARALLGWNQIQLAAAAGLTEITIKDLERGLANPRDSTVDRLLTAFDEAGVVFFEAGEVKDGGPGLRLKGRE
jgi:transcriptional regulator with XRE-family HTH domain